MADIVGPPKKKIRNRPIAPELRALLDGAADATSVEKIVIISGGQTSSRDPSLKNKIGGWTGSRRHDNGRAADIQLMKNGRVLRFTDTDGSQVAGFVTAAAARGAIGIGAGEGYMGRTTIHVGFGQTVADRTEVVWGANDSSANAPRWLRAAARAGWAAPVYSSAFAEATPAGSYHSVVMAREGLWLRKGAGLGFDRAKLLEMGSELTILGFDGEWARVSLRGDAFIDGHVYAAYLKSADQSVGDGGQEPEPDEDGLELIGDGGEEPTGEDGDKPRSDGPGNDAEVNEGPASGSARSRRARRARGGSPADA